MLPTMLASPGNALEASWPVRVSCRARAWHVLDRQRADRTTTWRLVRDVEMPRLIAAPPDEVVALPAGVARVSRRAWARWVVSRARSSMPAWWPSRASHLPVDKVPWQFVVSMMMLSGHHRRVLLADDVGMGKTVQAALLLHEVHAREPDATTLVIAPAALIGQWTTELHVRAGLEATVLDAAALRAESASPRRLVDASRAGSCWLISIDLLRQPDVIALLARTRWTVLVVDEAHVCAPGSARLEAVARVALSSTRVLLLTACPTASGPGGADRLRDIGRRRGERAMPIVRRAASRLASTPRRTCVLRVALGRDHLALCERLDRFVERAYRETGAPGLLPALVLRRRAASCPAALVRSLERRLTVLGMRTPPSYSSGLFDAELEAREDDEALHLRAWRSDRDERVELEQLLHLARQLPDAGARLTAVARLVRRCAEPVVVFTAYLDSLRALHPLLSHLRTVFVHGEQPTPLRDAAIESFTRGDAHVLLTTDASAEGLNLHHRCRVVVHAEVPRSRRMFDQRNGRVDRYGQARRVHSVVIAGKTTEDDEALRRLRERASQDDAWLTAVQPVRCRRTELAGRVFDTFCRNTRGPTTPDAARDDGRLPMCVLRRRRWNRLASRLDLPSSARAVWVAAVRASGGAELSASRVLACMVLPTGELPSVEVTAWPTPLRAMAIRAGRVARRLQRWDADAARVALDAAADAHDLFSDAGTEAAADLPALSCRAPSVTLEPLAVVMAGRSKAVDLASGRVASLSDGRHDEVPG